MSLKRSNRRIITLITDFGTRDYYAGAIKGVVLSIAPDVQVVDITHDIEPHHVVQGAFVLGQSFPWFPPGTIHLAVVDPGVGSDRRIIIARYADQFIIAPDNGLVTFVHRDAQAQEVYVVEDRRFFLPRLSSSFHGRDMMAPVAAHCARGVEAREFGRGTDHLELLSIRMEGESVGQALRGSVLYVDRFGTFVTNIGHSQLTTLAGARAALAVFVNGEKIGPVRFTFSDVRPGETVALVGGTGQLEIAVNRGRAADRFGPAEAVRVEVHAVAGDAGGREL